MFPGDADGDADDVDADDGAGDSEEILRVDKEIENKARIPLLVLNSVPLRKGCI